MASLTIRNLEEDIKTRLRVRAAGRGKSMEEEARQILRDALQYPNLDSLADLALRLFGPEHGVELPPHPPVKASHAPDFGPT
jgi:plasmid stability protein